MEWFSLSKQSFSFNMFSGSHLIILGIFILVSFVIFLNREKLHHEKWRKVELGIAISLILVELTYHVWMYVNGVWKINHSLSMELCSISLILCVILLLTRKKIVFEILIFTALLGATQAILTPALTYDFPHFRFFHFFYTHLMVIWVTFYFTWAKEYYPTFQSVIKLIIFLNLLLPLTLFINRQTNGNY